MSAVSTPDAPDRQADPGGDPGADWEALRRAAREAMTRAYAPYSRYPVGAAALADDGRTVRTVTGCNVETNHFGLALCAECGVVSALYATGGGRLTHLTCCDGQGRVITPCGRCRQLLMEHGGPGLAVDTPEGVRPLAELLPLPWGPDETPGQ